MPIVLPQEAIWKGMDDGQECRECFRMKQRMMGVMMITLD